MVTLFVFGLAIATVCMAEPRTKRQLAAAARKAIGHYSTRHGSSAILREGELKQLYACNAFTMMGYEQGGFAIIANDDLLPAVLGYSERSWHETSQNENFRWWMENMEKAAAEHAANGVLRSAIKPSNLDLSPAVTPIVKAEWGQYAPYNELCPRALPQNGYGNWGQSIVGCVATAMSQIFYTLRYPTTGQGTHSVSVPFQDPTKTYTVDFSTAHYDYDMMLDRYDAGTYTQEQAQAVATLCYHCGVASDMQYATDFSGSTNEWALEGLHRNFGMTTARMYERKDFSDREWMNLLFEELNEGRPMLYTGVDTGPQGYGHAFVIDGYDEQGLVHVNWGWNGDENGYYNIDLLNPGSLGFTSLQNVIIGIEAPSTNEGIERDITLTRTTRLDDLLSPEERPWVYSLKVRGNVNEDDLRVIRQLPRLGLLDLGEATLEDGTLGNRALYGCRRLQEVIFPQDLKRIGDGVLGMCSRIVSVEMPMSGDNYMMDNGIIYNKDETEIISVLPSFVGKLRIGNGITRLHNDALSGCTRLTCLELPASLKEIGSCGLQNCYNIEELTIRRYDPIDVTDDVFEGFDRVQTVICLPIGALDAYQKAIGWRDLFEENEHTTTYGTLIRVRNVAREYGGDMPEYGYEMEGDVVEMGEIEFTCEADALSSVGRYPIHAELNGITAPDVTVHDGYLAVTKAPLSVEAVDTGTKDERGYPVLKLVFDGFKNGEDEEAIDVMPTISYVPVHTSVSGEFEVVISGGAARNYEFVFATGMTVVLPVATGLNASSCFEEDRGYDVDIQGRRMSHVCRGIVLRNGKKIMIK